MKASTWISVLLIVALTALAAVALYDTLFSPPEHTQGIIVEKVFVAGHTKSGETPYGGVKRSRYFVTHQRDDQWVAFVKVATGDTLQVHCTSDHFEDKNVGDVLHFKKYEGHLLHIKFLAHNEEEE